MTGAQPERDSVRPATGGAMRELSSRPGRWRTMPPVAPAPNGVAPGQDARGVAGEGAGAVDDTAGPAGTTEPADAASSVQAVNLPLQVLDQLLGSSVVPNDAKIAAIDAWRRELAEAQLLEPCLGALHDRLSTARRLLARMRVSPDETER